MLEASRTGCSGHTRRAITIELRLTQQAVVNCKWQAAQTCRRSVNTCRRMSDPYSALRALGRQHLQPRRPPLSAPLPLAAFIASSLLAGFAPPKFDLIGAAAAYAASTGLSALRLRSPEPAARRGVAVGAHRRHWDLGDGPVAVAVLRAHNACAHSADPA
jgi:hypothetical protein